MIPISLYIHIPWCIKKCPYCDFNSHKSPQTLPEKDYINALIADLKADLKSFPARQSIQSIFIGGGTPSLFSAEAYERLFAALTSHLTFAHDIEITLEANPGAIEQQRFHDYRQLGINRLSLGIQSFNKTHLARLGRIHDDRQAHQAIESAQKAGFDNVNLDIMYGLPEQSITEGLADLKTALSFAPKHLSWYQLTLEPNTVFYKKPPKLPNEDMIEALETQGRRLLEENALKRYEISAYSLPNYESRHNLNYWLFGDYYGIGAGAHSKLTEDSTQNVYRLRKHRQPNDYIADDKAFLAANECVPHQELAFEFMLNATRLESLIPNNLFSQRTGLSFELIRDPFKRAVEKGLITMKDEGWQVTSLGRRYTNDLQLLFLHEKNTL